jgi:hypothetical protein
MLPNDHPNAFASLAAWGLSFATQWLIQRYAHAGVSEGWKQTINGAAIFVVLLIGREGIKGALVRLWAAAKTLWHGSPKPPVRAKK